MRIISSTHGPQRSSEGDIIRLGYGWSVPTNGSIGTLTVSHRYGQLVQEMLDRERFDVLHFHEPFVPFLSLQLLRHSTSVNVATFHAYSGFSPSYEFGKRMLQRFARRLHGRIAVSAAARHFIGRYFPGEYKVIPNGVDLRQFDDVPPFARWRDGIPNILFVGRFESRKGLMYLLRAYYQLRLEGLDCRLLHRRRTGPQEREARRYIATRRLGGVELLGRVTDHDKARAFATADVFVSPATGQESFGIVLLEAMAAGVPIVCSDIHGYKGVVRRDEQALLVPPRDVRGPRRRRSARCCATRCCASAWASPGARARRAVRLGEHHRQGRGLLRLRHPPPRGDRQRCRPASAQRSPRRRRAPPVAPRLWTSPTAVVPIEPGDRDARADRAIRRRERATRTPVRRSARRARPRGSAGPAAVVRRRSAALAPSAASAASSGPTSAPRARRRRRRGRRDDR